MISRWAPEDRRLPYRIPLWSASIGSLVWIGLAFQPVVLIEWLLLLAPLVLVPLVFAVAESKIHMDPWLLWSQAPCAILVSMGHLWPPGWYSVGWTLPWLIVTLFFVVSASRRSWLSGDEDLASLLLVVAHFYLVVGAGWLVISRVDWQPLGFPPVIVLLTAVHFHHAGFVTVSIAALTVHFKRGRNRLIRWCAVGLAAAPPLVALGITYSPRVEFLSALLLAGSLIGLGLAIEWTVIPQLRRPMSQALLHVAALVPILSMSAALIYAWGELTGQVLIQIPTMARWHGLLNAFGFELSALVGWLLERELGTGNWESGLE